MIQDQGLSAQRKPPWQGTGNAVEVKGVSKSDGKPMYLAPTNLPKITVSSKLKVVYIMLYFNSICSFWPSFRSSRLSAPSRSQSRSRSRSLSAVLIAPATHLDHTKPLCHTPMAAVSRPAYLNPGGDIRVVRV